MNKKTVYGICFAVGLLIGVAVFIGYYDVKRQLEDSLFYLYFTTLNVVITSVLTILIYLVNKRTADVNGKMADINEEMVMLNKRSLEIEERAIYLEETTSNITLKLMVNAEMKELNYLKGKLDEYIKNAEIIIGFSSVHLSINTKMKELVFKYKDPSIDIKELTNPKWFKYILRSDIEYGDGDLDEDDVEKRHLDDIKRNFDKYIPSGYKARYNLKDLEDNFSNLKKFKSDIDYYRFIINSEIPKNFIDILEIYIPRIYQMNTDISLGFPYLKVKPSDADNIYFNSNQIFDFLQNLKVLITEEQEEILSLVNSNKTKE